MEWHSLHQHITVTGVPVWASDNNRDLPLSRNIEENDDKERGEDLRITTALLMPRQQIATRELGSACLFDS